MIEKPLFIIICTYLVSFSVLTAQWFADQYDITLTNYQGVEIKSNLLDILDLDNLNTITADMAAAQGQENGTLSPVENAFNIGMFVGWELLGILTGTYIFNFMYLMGVPAIVIGGILLVYFIMVGRTIIAYIRGV